jgi:hypothetical protein
MFEITLGLTAETRDPKLALYACKEKLFRLSLDTLLFNEYSISVSVCPQDLRNKINLSITV